MNRIDTSSQDARVLAAVPAGHPGLSASDLIERLADIVPAAKAMAVINAAIDEGTVQQDMHFRYIRTDPVQS